MISSVFPFALVKDKVRKRKSWKAFPPQTPAPLPPKKKESRDQIIIVGPESLQYPRVASRSRSPPSRAAFHFIEHRPLPRYPRPLLPGGGCPL